RRFLSSRLARRGRPGPAGAVPVSGHDHVRGVARRVWRRPRRGPRRALGAADPSRRRPAKDRGRAALVTIVGFDTSLPVTAACVLRADGRAFATPPPSTERLLGRPEHSAELLPVLAELLE